MLHALTTAPDRITSFSKNVLDELEREICDAANRVADRHGFSMENLTLMANGDAEDHADAKLQFSTVDRMGLDRSARLLLEKGDSIGIPPKLFGRDIIVPRSGATPSTYTITGLVPPLNDTPEAGYLVRLFDIEQREIFHCSAEIFKCIINQVRN